MTKPSLTEAPTGTRDAGYRTTAVHAAAGPPTCLRAGPPARGRHGGR